MRVAFDTNILLSSTLWDGSVAQKLLFKLIKGDVKIFVSEDILSEYKKVLGRDFEYSNEEIHVIVGKLLLFLNLVTPVERLALSKKTLMTTKSLTALWHLLLTI